MGKWKPKAVRELKTGGNYVLTDKIERKRGRATTVRVTVQKGNHFYNPNTALCKVIGDQLLVDSMSSPVRFPKERIGELANLPDPVEQRRSQAAILAKKYSTEHYRLAQIYSRISRDFLSEAECNDVFRIVGGLLGSKSERAANKIGSWAFRGHGEAGDGASGRQAHALGSGEAVPGESGEAQAGREGDGLGALHGVPSGSSEPDDLEPDCELAGPGSDSAGLAEFDATDED